MSLKQIPRDPLRFDLLELFAVYGLHERISLTDPAATESFVDRVRESIKASLAHESLLHGLQAQAMFEGLVVSLGRVRFCKQEDVGNAYSGEEDLRIPDFSVVLPDGSRYLIEVKNHFQGMRSFKDFRMRAHDLDGLARYAAMMDCELRLAIYWTRWNRGSLVPPSTFVGFGRYRVLSMRNAFMADEMAILGDRWIGAKFPLTLRLVVDESKPRSVGVDGRVEFTIGDVHVLCADRLVTDEVERRIALFLMLYGEWEHEGPRARIIDGQLQSIDHQVRPARDHGQGFEVIGSMSSMHSSFHRQATAGEQGMTQLRMAIAPGALGNMIPDGYRGDALPLWIFEMKPPLPGDQSVVADGTAEDTARS